MPIVMNSADHPFYWDGWAEAMRYHDENSIGQNSRVTLYPCRRNRLFCWHRKKHLRVSMSSNAATVFCGKCFRTRFTVLSESHKTWVCDYDDTDTIHWHEKEK